MKSYTLEDAVVTMAEIFTVCDDSNTASEERLKKIKKLILAFLERHKAEGKPHE